MRRKPMVFLFLSSLLLAISLSMPFQIVWEMDKPFDQFLYQLDKMTILNWIVFSFGIINSYLIFNVFGIVRFTLPLYLAALIYNNYLVTKLHPYNQNALPYIFSLAVLFAVILALFKHKLWQYLSRPHLRWWATSPRVSRSLPVIVHSKEVKNMRAKTYDLSSTGAFLCQLDDSWNVKINEEVKLHIDALRFECRAKIIRITFGKGDYPEGVGIRFEHLNDHSKALIEYFITGRPENLMAIKDSDNSINDNYLK